MEIAFDTSETATGEFLVTVVPSPICPFELTPQHLTVMSESIAQEWEPPAETETAFDIPETATGEDLFVVLPSPSLPPTL